MRGLFINNIRAKDSIHISGKMVFDCLSGSATFSLDYIEISTDNRNIQTGYDFYLFNYHPVTMAWLDTRCLREQLGTVGTIVLEVLPNDPFVMCPKKDFDFYVVLDPTVDIRNKKVFPFPRPLQKLNFTVPRTQNDIPVIGSFGFATRGKGFQHVVEAVNKEFDKATVRINIPYGDFVPDSEQYASFLSQLCQSKAKAGITVEVTHKFMTDEELIKWCASNTLNCFLYDRDMPGLSATTDQAIVSERPLAIANNPTFRHITAYLPFYPKWSLQDAIRKSGAIVKQIKEDWSRENFLKRFEQLLGCIQFHKPREGTIELRVRQYTTFDLIGKRVEKYKRKLKTFSLKKLINDPGNSKKII